ncbi:MAG: hypothetical protein M3P26_03555 [Gemmatimonadota bacterium]|nr:hypothetical protein [Gemmatimonadota bacterium]
MRFIPTLCAIVLIAPATGLSQMSVANEVRVDAGSRVRIASPVFGSKKQVATVVSITPDTLVLRQGASTTYRSIATSDITALEISSGRYSRKAKGALWGSLIGAGAGAALGYFSYKDPKPCPEFSCFSLDFGPGSKGDAALFGGALGGLVGALVGTFIGRHPTDAWVPATVGTR